MKEIISILTIILIMTLVSKGQEPCIPEFKYKNDTAFKIGEDKPFTGEYTEYYPGDPKVRGNYISGLKHGQFHYYSSKNRKDSIVEYKFGKRNGKALTFYSFNRRYESSKNYKNNILHGASYFWTTSGQLDQIKTYNNGREIDVENLPVDSNIQYISFIIEGEKDGILPLSEIKDTLFIKIIKIINIGTSSSPVTKLELIEGYNIKSYEFSAGWAGRDISLVNIESSFLPKKVKNYILSDGFQSFYIGDLIVEDINGAICTLGTRKINVKK